MEKKIITPQECARLIPHWPSINPEKLRKLSTIITRGTRILRGEQVMSCPPIVLDKEGFILNGRHRAAQSVLGEMNVEGCVIFNPNEIFHHLPRECYGETGKEGVLEAFENRYSLVNFCHQQGIYTIQDLLNRNRR